MLISKIIFFLKYYLIYFKIKNILKNNHYHTYKHPDSASCKITLGKKNVEGIQSSGNIYMTRDK
jgi:hypothetical protein